MTVEEYVGEVKRIDHASKVRKKELAIKYALSNNSVKVGDLVEDNIGIGKVVEIEVGIGYMKVVPECIYNVREYTKAGIPTKRHKVRDVWQCDLD